MKVRSNEQTNLQTLRTAELAQVCGGILEKIEPGDEFLTVAEMINREIAKHPLLWGTTADPIGKFNHPWF